MGAARMVCLPTGVGAVSAATLLASSAAFTPHHPCSVLGVRKISDQVSWAVIDIGFAGDNCDVNIDECASGPCLHNGECIDGIGSIRCHCTDGYAGEHCQVNIDECSSKPCQNTGVCIDSVDAYTCECTAGVYEGENCATSVNVCASNEDSCDPVSIFARTHCAAETLPAAFANRLTVDTAAGRWFRTMPRVCISGLASIYAIATVAIPRPIKASSALS
eukprot:COSAG06_NODE_9492_length_1888_cov_0.830632_2_plen_219_part_00